MAPKLFSLKYKIKHPPNLFFSFLQKAYYFLIHFHIPNTLIARIFYRTLHNSTAATSYIIRYIIKVFYIEPSFRALCSEVGQNLNIEQIPYISGAGSIVIGNNVVLSGKLNMSIGGPQFGPGTIRIGDHTFLGHNCSLIANKEISIGSHCLISGGVRIYDNDGHPINSELRRLNQAAPPGNVRPVMIEDNVWIGTSSIILKGVTIGNNSIIGAGSVVRGNIPPYCLAIGNPAKVIRKLG